MQYGCPAPRRGRGARDRASRPGAAPGTGARSSPTASSPHGPRGRPPVRGQALGVEYQVRAARITDVERIVALVASAAPAAAAATSEGADLLRQLVYLPQASVLVVE